MKTLLYANRAEPKSISVISILLLAAVGDITKLHCMHRECYIFASQNLWLHTAAPPSVEDEGEQVLYLLIIGPMM